MVLIERVSGLVQVVQKCDSKPTMSVEVCGLGTITEDNNNRGFSSRERRFHK